LDIFQSILHFHNHNYYRKKQILFYSLHKDISEKLESQEWKNNHCSFHTKARKKSVIQRKKSGIKNKENLLKCSG